MPGDGVYGMRRRYDRTGGERNAIRSGLYTGAKACEADKATGALLAAVPFADTGGCLYLCFQLYALIRHSNRIPRLLSSERLLEFALGWVEIFRAFLFIAGLLESDKKYVDSEHLQFGGWVPVADCSSVDAEPVQQNRLQETGAKCHLCATLCFHGGAGRHD